MRTHLRIYVLLLVTTGLTSGCFRHVPIPLETAPPGEEVRVLITSTGATELGSVMELDGPAPLVSGTLVGREGDHLLLRVPVGRRQEGFIQSSLNQTIRVPVGEVVTFERREFDAVGTSLLIGGSAALATAIVVFILDPFGESDLDTDPDPDDLRFHLGLLSIPFGD